MGDETPSGTRATWRPDLPPSSESPIRTVLVAVGLGLLGPALALVMFFIAALVSFALDLPLAGRVVLALVGGQYVAFGGLALAYLRYRGLDWAGVRSYLGIGWPGIRGFVVAIGGWLLILVLAFGAVAVVQLLDAEPAQNQTVQQAMETPEIILLLIPAMFLVVGPSEEILYRGVVQGRLRERLGPAPAILIASAVFAAVHVMALTGGLTARLTTVAILFVPSLVFGAIYEYTGNLVVPALTHGIHNSFLLFMLYLALRFAPEGELEGATSLLLAGLPL